MAADHSRSLLADSHVRQAARSMARQFPRVETRRRGRRVHTLGLLADLPQKNCSTIAERQRSAAITASLVTMTGAIAAPVLADPEGHRAR
jgi:hypothetical protein